MVVSTELVKRKVCKLHPISSQSLSELIMQPHHQDNNHLTHMNSPSNRIHSSMLMNAIALVVNWIVVSFETNGFLYGHGALS